ncbi:hypothetical protein [Nocardiopsis sinuspersici]|uniref:hypothetical protein n=1 Tax=Nocardiopsis sinuspersici TaxID=501010 RepID=UPI001C0C8318|nr:hypothetical protein [Nocardiopsis sinuspersici]
MDGGRTHTSARAGLRASADAAPLRAAALGGAAFTEILPPVRATDGAASLLRY